MKSIKKTIGFLCGVAFCAVAFIGTPQITKAAEVVIDEANFPDETFRNYVIENFDKDLDKKLSDIEISEAKEINVYMYGIYNFKGLEYFLYLTSLDCSQNNMSNLDVSQNIALTSLNCSESELSNLDVSQNTALISLDCSGNELSDLDISKNIALTSLNCSQNKLSSLDVSQNTALTSLDCSGIASGDNIKNNLSNLDVSQNTALTFLKCNSNGLSNLDVSQNAALTFLDCRFNQLSQLKLNGHTYGNCKLFIKEDEDVLSDLQNIKESYAYYDYLDGERDIDTIEVIDITKSATCKINGNALTITYTDVPAGIATNIPSTTPADDKTATITGDIAIDKANFPDEKFRNYVIENFDTDKNNILSSGEIAEAKEIKIAEKEVKDLKGIEHFVMLTKLNCDTNQIKTLDLSKNTALETLICGNNNLESLNLIKNTCLTYLFCANNPMVQLRLPDEAYKELKLYPTDLHVDDILSLKLSDFQNIEYDDEEEYAIVLKVIDITKPATYKVNGKDFTLIYASAAASIPEDTPSKDSSDNISDDTAVKKQIKKVEAVKKTVTIKKNKKIGVNFKITTTGNKKVKASEVKVVIKNKKIAKAVKINIKAEKIIVTVKGLKKGKTTLKLDAGGKTALTTLKIK